MVGWLIGAICLACVGFSLYGLQRSQIKRLTAKLRQMNDEQRIERCTMSLPSAVNRNLIIEINRFIASKEESEKGHRISELKMQELISNISHDMRTPLTAILGYLHFIQDHATTDTERTDYLEIVEKRARDLQRLILDFYDLSRLDEGEYPFHLQWLDVNALCLERLAQSYNDFEVSGVALQVHLLPIAPKVWADEQALMRILDNLLQNAQKYGRESLRVESRVEGDWLIMSFSNPSDEPNKERIEQVFERSYTLSRSRSKGSTGLGLSICKAFLERMGHEINASYYHGTFTIQILWHIGSED